MKKAFVFTMDDNIRFLQELTKSDMQSKKKEEYYGCFMDNAQKRYGFCSARNTGIFISKNERIGAGSMVLMVVIILNIITNILMYTLGIYLVSGG